MSNPQEHASRWVMWLAHNRKLVSYILIGLALPFAGLAIWWGVKAFKDPITPWDVTALTFWSTLMAMIALGGGLFQLLNEPASNTEEDNARLLILGLGGLIGFTTFLASLMLAWAWWEFVVSWLEPGQVKEWWKGLVVALAMLGSLGLMFGCLHGARTEERSNVTLRRLIYGYNAVLTGLLLLAILVVVNALLYIKFPQNIDFTSSNIYTLSSRSKNVLAGLDRPLKIIAIMPAGFLGDEVKTLLINCREINPKIEVEELSPNLNEERLDELQKKYSFSDPAGLLVIYGDDSRFDSRFVPISDLFSQDSPRGRPAGEKESFKFKGEDALLTQIDALTNEKKKPVVYFTQGNGEMDFNSMEAEGGRIDRGIGTFRDRLTKRNYETKILTFSQSDTKWMDDATIVVIAGPTVPLPDHALKALRQYMNPTAPEKPKGRLLILLDTPKVNALQTGLIDLLREYSVQVENERILTLPTDLNQGQVQRVLVLANPQSSNPIAKAFRGELFAMFGVRPIQPTSAPERSPMENRYSAQILFQAPENQLVLVDKKLEISPLELIRDLMKDRAQASKSVSNKPVPVAVAVTESNPMNPHAGFMEAPDAKPRLVVFGNSSMASNRFMAERAGRMDFDILAGSLDWLRERPSSIGIPPKTRDVFVLGQGTSIPRMVLMPSLLMFAGIIGLGIGVWVVRRR